MAEDEEMELKQLIKHDGKDKSLKNSSRRRSSMKNPRKTESLKIVRRCEQKKSYSALKSRDEENTPKKHVRMKEQTSNIAIEETSDCSKGLEQIPCIVKELETKEAAKSQTKSSVPPRRISIPHMFYRTCHVTVPVDVIRNIEVSITPNLVVHHVGRYSQLACYILVGDQILEVNDYPARSQQQLAQILNTVDKPTKFSVLRPWNTTAPSEERLRHVKRQNHFYYVVVDAYCFKGLKNGFVLTRPSGKNTFYVSMIEPNSRAAYCFIRHDRLLDINGIPMSSFNGNLAKVRTAVKETLSKDGWCSFLIERYAGLRSTPNPSCTAATIPTTEYEMGEDSRELGGREATKFFLVKKRFKPVSILKAKSVVQLSKELLEAAESDTDAVSRFIDVKLDMEKRCSSPAQSSLKEIKRLQKGKKKSLILEQNETSRIPTEVKDPSELQKVTPKSGVINFVRSWF